MLISQKFVDVFYNRPKPQPSELLAVQLKCLPGRTTIKVSEKKLKPVTNDQEQSEEFYARQGTKTRRQTTSAFTNVGEFDQCKICICSVDGTTEVCLKRPIGTVSECLVLSQSAKITERGEPYEHYRNLQFRIRRDLLWHNDEIPYYPSAKCYRGHSYYTNHATPNDTNIDYEKEVTSLLDFESEQDCFFCVCSVSGDGASCIPRHLWFCNYFRYLRSDNAARDMYGNLFQQDRPTYFRQISWRIRRTMDDDLFDLIEQGGDALCCQHSDGHRRQIQNSVREKLRSLRRRIPKENLLGGAMRPGADYVDFIVNNDK